MISDVLFDAVEKIDGYLNTKTYDEVYQGEDRKEILDVRNRMEALRVKLDTPAKETDTIVFQSQNGEEIFRVTKE